jgi:hypothetical protein
MVFPSALAVVSGMFPSAKVYVVELVHAADGTFVFGELWVVTEV